MRDFIILIILVVLLITKKKKKVERVSNVPPSDPDTPILASGLRLVSKCLKSRNRSPFMLNMILRKWIKSISSKLIPKEKAELAAELLKVHEVSRQMKELGFATVDEYSEYLIEEIQKDDVAKV